MDSAAPKISVITPSFNQVAYIEQTMRSVLDQGYPNLEYIVIDGGSTDGSVEIIKKFQDKLSYWVSEKDRGQAHAINKGLQVATGEIIGYLNSDDYYLDGSLARVAEAHRRDPRVDLWHGRCRVVDQHGSKIDERAGSISRYEDLLDLWDVWWKRRNFVQPEVFWTRRIGNKVGAFREDLHYVMDYEYWLRILGTGGKVGYINTEIAAFRLQPAQKSRLSAESAEEQLNVVQRYLVDRTYPMRAWKRLALEGKLIFHLKFSREVERSVNKGEGRLMRWMRLTLFCFKNPRILAARSLRERIFAALLPSKSMGSRR